MSWWAGRFSSVAETGTLPQAIPTACVTSHMQSYSIFRLLMVLLAAICVFAELDGIAGGESDYFVPYLKKAGPSGPLRFGKRRDGPSGPLRFGKRSSSLEYSLSAQQPYYFLV